MNHSVSAFLHAFLAMVGITSVVGTATESDFEWMLNRQPGLKTLPAQELDRRREECRASTIHRLTLLRRKTLASASFVLAASVIGVLFSSVVAARVTFSSPNILAVTSIICFAWATLGRLGWEGQSYGGKTIFEELDRQIFWGLYGAGTLLGTMAICIGS